jgi:hypothetical protein
VTNGSSNQVSRKLLPYCSGQNDGANIPYVLGVLVDRPVTAELGGTSCVEDRHSCP